MASSFALRSAWFMAASVVAGCGLVAGLDDYAPGEGAGGAPVGGSGGTTSSMGGGTSTGTGGAEAPPSAVSFGSDGLDTVRGLAIDAAGQIYLAGTHDGTIDFDVAHAPVGERGLFVAALDASFEPLRSESFPATAGSTFLDLDVSGLGRLAVIGWVDGATDLGAGELAPAGTGALLGAFGPDGGLLTSALYGTAMAGLREGKAVVSRSNVSYVGLAYDSDPELPPAAPAAPPVQGPRDSVIAAVDDAGMVSWASTLTGVGWQTIEAMVQDANNRLVVVGTTNAEANLDGLLLTPVGTDGKPDVFVARYNTDGVLVDATLFGGEGRTDVADVTVVGNRVIIGGYFQETLIVENEIYTGESEDDGFVVSLDEDLNLEWVRHLDGLGRQRVLSLSGHSSGQVAVAGEFVNTITLDRTYTEPDQAALAFVLDAEGTPTWSRVWGGADLDRARCVVMNGADELVVAGEFSNSITVDGTVLTTVGDRDLFVARLSLVR